MKRCPTCGQLERRTSAQNGRYWALMNEISWRLKVDGQNFAAKTWHLWFAERFLPQEEVKLPSGRMVLLRQSTSELAADVFSDYLTQVEAWAAERGIYLPDREEGHDDSHGQRRVEGNHEHHQ